MNIHAVDQGGESRPEYRARIRAQREADRLRTARIRAQAAQLGLVDEGPAQNHPEPDPIDEAAQADAQSWLRSRMSRLPRWQARLVEDRARRDLY